jgi:hypothetical protein
MSVIEVLWAIVWFGLALKGSYQAGEGKISTSPCRESIRFCSLSKTPVYVGGSSVLAQVWAVGLDDVDARLIGVCPLSSKQPSPGTPHGTEEKNDGKRSVPLGYNPGRSFVESVLEVRWDVDE